MEGQDALEGIERVSPATTPATRWVLSAEGSEARYRVREQLAGLDFPNDAVGITNSVAGAIVLADDGTLVSDQSEIRVDLTTLATDSERRDGYVQRRTLEVEEYPEAVLVPLRFMGLSGPIPETGSATFQLEGSLTLHGVTQTTVWEVSAEFGPDKISGLATTAFQFETFGIAVPSVARVLSVDDNIRLELQFLLVPGTS
jgi:polyisoprenoid-binding protein YceI